MTDKAIRQWTWAARLLTILGVLAGILAAAQQLPEWFRDYSTIAVALLGAVAAWIYSFLPAAGPGSGSWMPPTAVAVLMLAALAAGSCKLPPLATAYRTHALLITARDGAGETLAKVQRAKMLRCEADHRPSAPNWKALLKACYQDVRAPVTAWTKHVRPAITAAAAALWLALESAYIAGRKGLDTTARASALACATLTAAEVAIKPYAAQLGSLRVLVLGALAGGRLLVCP